jgi:hypothetical protein
MAPPGDKRIDAMMIALLSAYRKGLLIVPQGEGSREIRPISGCFSLETKLGFTKPLGNFIMPP